MKKIKLISISDIAVEIDRLIQLDFDTFKTEFNKVSEMPDPSSLEFAQQIRSIRNKSDSAAKSEYGNMSTPARYAYIEHTKGIKSFLGSNFCASLKMGAKHGVPLVAIVEMVAQLAEGKEKEAISNFVQGGIGVHGGVNNGNVYSSLFPLYHEYANSTSIHFDADIMKELQMTDLSSSVPVRMLEAPYKNTYIQFGPVGDNSVLSDDYFVNNAESGDHRLEGCLVTFHNERYISMIPESVEHLGITEDSDIRSIDIMFIGSPKDGIQDDATNHVTLAYDNNSDMPLNEVLKRAMNYYTNKQRNILHPEYVKMKDVEATNMARNIDLLSRCLVYMNCADCRRIDVDEISEIAKQLSNVKSPKKRRRIEKQLNKADKYVLIKPVSHSPFSVSNSDEVRHHKAHWRRGHIRMQPYGEGRLKTKMIHIRPVLVGHKNIGNTPNKPTYVVK